MSHDQLNLTNDELLSTTRAVRKRLDFDRPVPMSVVKECMEMAVRRLRLECPGLAIYVRDRPGQAGSDRRVLSSGVRDLQGYAGCDS